MAKLEMCAKCDQPTGKAGIGDGSLYCAKCEMGPYCAKCFNTGDDLCLQCARQVVEPTGDEDLYPTSPYENEDDADPADQDPLADIQEIIDNPSENDFGDR